MTDETTRPATAALRRALDAAGDGPLPADRDWAGLLTMVAVEALDSDWAPRLGERAWHADVPGSGRRRTMHEAVDEAFRRYRRALALAARAWEEREAHLIPPAIFDLHAPHEKPRHVTIEMDRRLSADLSAAIRALAGEAEA